MASLFQGEAPPNVQTTRETAAVAPQYLTDYLTQLATQGQQTLGVKDPVTGVKSENIEPKARPIAN